MHALLLSYVNSDYHFIYVILTGAWILRGQTNEYFVKILCLNLDSSLFQMVSWQSPDCVLLSCFFPKDILSQMTPLQYRHNDMKIFIFKVRYPLLTYVLNVSLINKEKKHCAVVEYHYNCFSTSILRLSQVALLSFICMCTKRHSTLEFRSPLTVY